MAILELIFESAVPWRWVAPEALKTNQFTDKTDVWAFGITVWEIFSFGKLPFGGINNINNLVSFLDDFEEVNYRLEKPKNISMDYYYKIIASCQEYDQNDRPNFGKLKKLSRFCIDNWCFYASKNVKSVFEENNGIYRKFKKHFSWSSDSFS